LDRALIEVFPQNAATDASVDWSMGSIQSETPQVSTMKQPTPVKHLIQELGWTEEQTAEIRHRLASFEEYWDAPGMEIYDLLSRF
jgi:hypothetical protein